MNEITITKLANGDYQVVGPAVNRRYEQAMNVITEVRTQLNLLKLPSQPKESALGHDKFCQCSMCLKEQSK